MTRTKHSIESCRLKARERNGLCLDDTYINCDTKMRWRCHNGHEWMAVFSNINRNIWCSKCQNLTIEDCMKTALDRGGACLETVYVNNKTNMKWRCNNNHEWFARYDRVKQGTWCLQCCKLTIDDCHRIALENEGKCLETVYANNYTLMKWECEQGHAWETSFHHIKDHGAWCPHCRNKSENIVDDWLKVTYNPENDSEMIRRDRPTAFSNKKRYDFLLEVFKIIIELDGGHHFKQVMNWNSPEYQQANDIQKTIAANENGYSVIRLCQDDVFNDKIDWKTLLKHNIKLHEIPVNMFFSSNGELYDNHKQ